MRRFLFLIIIFALAFDPNAGALHFSITGGLIAGLNRDLTRIDEITSDKITGALDATMSIDNRVFTGAGWASIASDVTNFWGNLAKAGEGAGKAVAYSGKVVGDILQTVADAFGENGFGLRGVFGTAYDPANHGRAAEHLPQLRGIPERQARFQAG